MNEHRIETRRRARYYTAGGDASVTDAWMVCHGFGQLAGRFMSHFDGIATPNRLIVAPEALNRFYLTTDGDGSHAQARVGTTWMTREDRESEIADYVDYLDAVYRAVIPVNVPLTVLGFSQGVATAARWTARGVAAVTRFIAWAGQLPPDVEPGHLAARVRRPILIVSGNDDEHAQWVQLETQQERLVQAGVAVERRLFNGGHRLDRATLAELADG
ncbi:MAG: hypothetical protein U0163_12485 [Gemmatimonadaceae bacterium]